MINCPSCNSIVTELLACDSCNMVGCVRCITRFNRQWVCKNCKSGVKRIKVNEIKSESNLFSMFG